MWRRRRRSQPEPVVLPSLDRLSGLVERVVELVEAVGDSTPMPAPEPERAPEQLAAATTATAWVAFVGSPHGYRLVEATGAVPRRGTVVELEGEPHRVTKTGPSPLPGDRRPCAYVEREEAPASERTSDA